VSTTTDIVSDAYENEFSTEIAGSGRLNVTRAFNANTIIFPHNLIFNLSPEKQSDTKSLLLRTITGDLVQLKIQIPGPDVLDFTFKQEDDVLHITSSLNDEVYGKFNARIFIQDDKTTYNVPVLVQVTEGAIGITEDDGKLNFKISHPDEWSYAKISLINSITGKEKTTTSTPNRDGIILAPENGLYWVEANIKVNDETFDAYETIQVESVSTYGVLDIFQSISVPERQLAIIFGIIAIISLVGLKIRKESMKV